MTGPATVIDFGQRLLECYPQLAGRLTYLPRAVVADLAAIRHGVVFFMAWWSGPARQALTALTDVIHRADTLGTLTLTVVDVDGVAEGFDRPPFDQLGWLGMGCGQTLWVSHGEVFHANRFGAQTDRLLDYTFDLLRHPPKSPA